MKNLSQVQVKPPVSDLLRCSLPTWQGSEDERGGSGRGGYLLLNLARLGIGGTLTWHQPEGYQVSLWLKVCANSVALSLVMGLVPTSPVSRHWGPKRGLALPPFGSFQWSMPQSPKLRFLRPLCSLWLLLYRESQGFWEHREWEAVTLPTFLGILTGCCSSDSAGGILWFRTSKPGTLAPLLRGHSSLTPG